MLIKTWLNSDWRKKNNVEANEGNFKKFLEGVLSSKAPDVYDKIARGEMPSSSDAVRLLALALALKKDNPELYAQVVAAFKSFQKKG